MASNRKIMGGTVDKEMEPIIKKAKKQGMKCLGWAHSEELKSSGSIHTEAVPDWIEVPERFAMSGSRGEYSKINGDNCVYWLISNGANTALVYRQLKSNYYTTTSEEGTCPNCQSYVKRYESDEYLTCHRCGWQYNPLKERIKNIF